MPKSKINYKQSLSVEGYIDIQSNGSILIDVMDIGKKKLDELLIKFNGENIKLNISRSDEITK